MNSLISDGVQDRTQRGNMGIRDQRVRATVDARARHSFVIEFPSALWLGFTLLMASCVSADPQDSLLILLKKPESFHTFLKVNRENTR